MTFVLTLAHRAVRAARPSRLIRAEFRAWSAMVPAPMAPSARARLFLLPATVLLPVIVRTVAPASRLPIVPAPVRK